MESQPDIVAAAEALRSWVHTQRANWTEPAPSRKTLTIPTPPSPATAGTRDVVESPAAHQPVAEHEAVPLARGIEPAWLREEDEPILPRPASLPPPATPTPEPFPEPVSPAPVSIPAAEVLPRAQSIHIDIDDPPSSIFEQWRIALAAALIIAVVGAGGTAVWRRGANAPRVGTAAFDSVPPGAQVFVDGKPVGTTPVRVELNPGPHGVEFKLKQATRVQTIDIKKGAELPVLVDWNPRRTGALEVASTPPAAKVLVDGRERGQTPLTIDDLTIGNHSVQIESSEGTVRRTVTIAEGKTESVSEPIYPGWLVVSAPIEVTVSEGGKGLQLDATSRVLMKPGSHTIRIDNRELAFSQTRQVEVEPGGVARLSVDVPTSTLTVTGSTGASVLVDGTKVGETPLVDFQVKIGTRDVMVVDQSGETRHATVTITTRPTSIDIPLSRP